MKRKPQSLQAVIGEGLRYALGDSIGQIVRCRRIFRIAKIENTGKPVGFCCNRASPYHPGCHSGDDFPFQAFGRDYFFWLSRAFLTAFLYSEISSAASGFFG